MKIMVVDDEHLARERLLRLLEGIDWVRSASEAASGEEALALQTRSPADLILLDIRMPGMDGMEAARRLSQLAAPPAVIFTTAYEEHALEAFEAKALDYLVKPVRAERLREALQRIRRLLPVVHESPRLTIRKHGELHLIALDEVIYFQADHKYVTAYLADREELLEESLKQLEEAWPERLLRVHRNALVAIAALEGLARQPDGSWRVLLKGAGSGPEVSRRHVPLVRRLLRANGGG